MQFSNMKKWIRLIAFLLVFAVLCECMNVMFMIRDKHAMIQAQELKDNPNSYDIVVIGSSTAWRSWNPIAANDVLGEKSINLATNGSKAEGEDYAKFQEAFVNQKPKRVICVIEPHEYNSMDQEHFDCYDYYYMSKHSFLVQMQYVARRLFYDNLLYTLFPWRENNVSSIEDLQARREKILDNIHSVTRPVEIPESYLGGGFFVEAGQYSFDNVDDFYVNKNARCDSQSQVSGVFMSRSEEYIIRMKEYCDAHDCQFILVTSPFPAGFIYSKTWYLDSINAAKRLSEEMDFLFLEMNWYKNKTWAETGFQNVEHLNYDGATAYTMELCKVLRDLDEGKDISEDFYQSWDEWTDAIVDVEAVYTYDDNVEDNILKAHAVVGSDVTPLYRWTIRDERDGEEVELTDWSQDDSLDLTGISEYQILRVYAKTDKSDVQRYYDYPHMEQY